MPSLRRRLLRLLFLLLYPLKQLDLPVVVNVSDLFPHFLEIFELMQTVVIHLGDHERGVPPIRLLRVVDVFVDVHVVELVPLVLFAHVFSVVIGQLIELLLDGRLELPPFPYLLRILIRVPDVLRSASQHLWLLSPLGLHGLRRHTSLLLLSQIACPSSLREMH